MRFTITLDLGDFIQRLRLHSTPGIILVDRLPGTEGNLIEHQAIGEIAVVRYGQDFTACLLLVACHVGPEIFRILRVVNRKWQDLARPVTIVAENYVAMQVAASRRRSPFKSNQGGENLRIVIAFGRLHELIPGCLLHAVVTGKWIVFVGNCLPPPCIGRAKIARLNQFGDLLTPFVIHHDGVGFDNHWRQPDILRMIGNHQKIQRALQLSLDAQARYHLFAPGKTVSLLRSERIAEQAGIDRVRGMHVCVPEKYLVGKVFADKRGIFAAIRTGIHQVCRGIGVGNEIV